LNKFKNADLDHCLVLFFRSCRIFCRRTPRKHIPIKKGAGLQIECRFLEGLVLQELPDQFRTRVLPFFPLFFILCRRQEQP